MGIIILPFLIGALVVAIKAVTKIYKLRSSIKLEYKEILLGFLLSLSIFTLITVWYIKEGEMWGLSLFFRIPIVAFFVPYSIHMVTRTSSNTKVAQASRLLLVSIGFSCVLGILYCTKIYGVLDHFGVKQVY